jgi:purine-nucleoside/S-methyl-5'-thioadenosine phosphorylase / adenosine deaminase
MVAVVQSSLLANAPGIRHAFFTRRGGVSKGIYSSLNVGVGSRDRPGAVEENRARCAAHFEVDLGHLLTCFQVHSATVMTADAPWFERPEADGVATAVPGLVCGALAADCAPVLIADPQARIVAAVHAGWKGALGGVVGEGMAAMVRLGADPARCVAAVGPCIGPESYEVGGEFRDRFDAEAAGSDRFFRPGPTAGKHMFDLPGFVLMRLEQAGVGEAEWIGADTVTGEADFFSNRRATLRQEPDYGRLLSAVMLQP